MPDLAGGGPPNQLGGGEIKKGTEVSLKIAGKPLLQSQPIHYNARSSTFVHGAAYLALLYRRCYLLFQVPVCRRYSILLVCTSHYHFVALLCRKRSFNSGAVQHITMAMTMQQQNAVFPKSHVGFDSITQQIEKKLLKRGFQLNIVCVSVDKSSPGCAMLNFSRSVRLD